MLVLSGERERTKSGYRELLQAAELRPGIIRPVTFPTASSRACRTYLYGQLGDRRDLGYLKRRSARDLGRGRGRILIAEVRE